MKTNLIRMISTSILGLGLCAANAQDSEVEQLRKEIRELRKHVEDLEKKVQASEQKPKEAPPPPPLVTPTPPAQPEQAATPPVTKPWSPADPIRIGKGSAYADIGMVATFAVGSSSASDIEGGTQL